MSVSANQILEVAKKNRVIDSIEEINVDASLSDQGVDSLDFSSLLFNIEETFDVQIPDEDIDKLSTINDIVQYINN